ncbi:MAG TPA: hypothetical protein VFJ85_13005 [Acidimicrobiales bacterium]|nr:hypothetical protein [Acidimicrobiales bacterium]
MASTQRFDGPNLEAVLAEVQAAHGEEARILNAHKVRAGGIAGFFARERFEVEVEVEAGQAAGADPGEEPLAFDDDGPASILELADGVSARESGEPAPPAPSPFAAVLAARFAAQSRAASVDAAGSIPPPASTEPAAAPEEAPATRPGLRLVPDPGPAGDWEPLVPATTEPPVRPAAPLVAAAAPAWPVAALAEPAPVPAPPAHPVVAEPVAASPEPLIVAEAPPAPVNPEPAPLIVAIAPPAPVTPEPAPEPAHPVLAARPAPRPGQAGDAVTVALFRRGLPLALLPEAPVADPRAALVAALRRLPGVPDLPGGRSAVIAVVGEREEALALAQRVARERGLDADEIVLASPTYRGRRVAAWNRLATFEEAESERRSWRRRTHATVVAVEAPVDGIHTEWAREMLTALEPNLTWGVVHAGHKTEDMAWWIDRIGGVDALAVEGTRRTVTPAGVLALGLPVGLLDGEPASPEGWAALLLPEAAR